MVEVTDNNGTLYTDYTVNGDPESSLAVTLGFDNTFDGQADTCGYCLPICHVWTGSDWSTDGILTVQASLPSSPPTCLPSSPSIMAILLVPSTPPDEPIDDSSSSSSSSTAQQEQQPPVAQETTIRDVLIGVFAGVILLGVLSYAVIYCRKSRQAVTSSKNKQVHVGTTSATFRMPNSTVLEIEIPELPSDVTAGANKNKEAPVLNVNPVAPKLSPRLASATSNEARATSPGVSQSSILLHGTSQQQARH